MDVKVGVSNRHVHLNIDDYKILFNDTVFEKDRDLVQTGEFSSKLKVSIKTEKKQIDNVRVLGPLRDYTQVEISKTDSYSLGIDPPVRDSGNLSDASLITIIGPFGTVKKNCCIIPTRHIHINKIDREAFNLSDIQKVSIKLGNEKKAILEDVYIKESTNGVFELHLDTDDANANFIKTGDIAKIV